MMRLKQVYYALFFVMVLGHVLDYFSTYFVLNRVGFEWELNKYVKDNGDLLLVKTMGLFHAISIIGLYHLIKDFFPKKAISFSQKFVLVAYIVPTIILWKATIVNINNVLFLML